MPLSRRLPPGLAGRIGGSVSGICRRGHIVMEDRRANCPTGQSTRVSCTAPLRYGPHYSQLPAFVKSPCRRASRPPVWSYLWSKCTSVNLSTGAGPALGKPPGGWIPWPERKAWQPWVSGTGAIFQSPFSFWNAAWIWYLLRPANWPTITACADEPSMVTPSSRLKLRSSRSSPS